MGDMENGGKAMSPFMKTVLLVATAGFLAWAGWLTNNALAYQTGRAAIEAERKAHELELKQMQDDHVQQVRDMNGHLQRIYERLGKIEWALAVENRR